ncbi:MULTISPECIES: NmrA family NAD(P)-binding protein [Mesorhizobium]|uniref:NmrA family NAD(P)-binding protein n=1 Tax=Mesorhizobium TaxID=68287 RepID=UPI000427C3A5|nr:MULTISPECIES: NmrA family NAD(P)-binding protein [Mesorhizobium]WJI40466.1 NmrA family NAD(P)-binding protein [Mesorhizobium opportunistum]
MTILAVGAAGRFAGNVIPALAQRNARVRGFVRKPEEIAQVREHGAAETAVGDLRDRASLDAALKDIEAVFYIAPAFMAEEAEVGKGLVNAAIRAGVRRLVFSSVIHPVLSVLGNHIAKAPVEEAILTSKLEYTFLHPSRFYQNYEAFWPKVIETGVLAEPWSAETRFSLVDYRDIAEVAAIALTEDRLLYGTFELCAPGWHNRHDVVTLLGEVLGREIRERRDPGVLGEVGPGQRTMFEHYDHYNLLGNPLTLRAILGHEPRSLKVFFEELAARAR